MPAIGTTRASIPAKRSPVRRRGYAPTRESRANPDSAGTGFAPAARVALALWQSPNRPVAISFAPQLRRAFSTPRPSRSEQNGDAPSWPPWLSARTRLRTARICPLKPFPCEANRAWNRSFRAHSGVAAWNLRANMERAPAWCVLRLRTLCADMHTRQVEGSDQS